MTSHLIQLINLSKNYKIGKSEVEVLKHINLSIESGDFLAIMGPSGSGKSTLLNLLGCLDTPTSGEFLLQGNNIESSTGQELADIRNKKIGFIFQNFNLIPSINVLENVLLPSVYAGTEKTEWAMEMLGKLGLKEKKDYMPNELSGGQKQRVAIARALVNSPEIILADEPTGALDSKTGKEIMDIILDLNKQEKRTIVMVTHDLQLAKLTHKIINIKDGVVT